MVISTHNIVWRNWRRLRLSRIAIGVGYCELLNVLLVQRDLHFTSVVVQVGRLPVALKWL
jgi:hypothetical protein